MGSILYRHVFEMSAAVVIGVLKEFGAQSVYAVSCEKQIMKKQKQNQKTG